MRTGGHGAAQVVQCAVSWPGITSQEVAEELGLAISSVRSYAVHARRAGWLHAGAVPRLVDHGAVWLADWRAAADLVGIEERVYRRVCLHYTYEIPARRENLQGFTDAQLRDALYRLRSRGLVQPCETLHATEAGEQYAYAMVGAA